MKREIEMKKKIYLVQVWTTDLSLIGLCLTTEPSFFLLWLLDQITYVVCKSCTKEIYLCFKKSRFSGPAAPGFPSWGSDIDQITPWDKLYVHSNFPVSRYKGLAGH